MQNVSVRILDRDGTALPAGQEGELEVEAPQNAVGYWRNPDATSLGFTEGRLRTGDVAVMDEEGWIYLVDRLKGMINVSGFQGLAPRGRRRPVRASRCLRGRCGRRA